MCVVKGVLSHRRLRPNKNKISAPCQFSLFLVFSPQRPWHSAVNYFLFGIGVCVCVGMRVQAWVGVLVCTCDGQRPAPGVAPRHPLPFWFLCFETESLIAWTLPTGLGRLASEPRGSACLSLPSAGNTRTCCLGQCFTSPLGTELRSFSFKASILPPGLFPQPQVPP